MWAHATRTADPQGVDLRYPFFILPILFPVVSTYSYILLPATVSAPGYTACVIRVKHPSTPPHPSRHVMACNGM